MQVPLSRDTSWLHDQTYQGGLHTLPCDAEFGYAYEIIDLVPVTQTPY